MWRVSIHARHCWRANRSPSESSISRSMFQSTPAIAGGRIIDAPDFSLQHLKVSIHARHCWRANPRHHPWRAAHPGVSIHARHCWRANLSRIVILGADDKVSIHARHCWRANHHKQQLTNLPRRSFNPRPPLLAGESKCSMPLRPRARRFNPRPPLLAGESARTYWQQRQRQSFNPRPPLLAGESVKQRLQRYDRVVSIHARHCWRANRLPCAACLCWR